MMLDEDLSRIASLIERRSQHWPGDWARDAELVRTAAKFMTVPFAIARRERVRALVLALLNDGRTYEPTAYADVVTLACMYDNQIESLS